MLYRVNYRGSLVLKQCVGCGQQISDQFLLFALDGYWHCRCLTCSCCFTPLAQIGTSCFTRSGMILCRSDYLRLFGTGGVCRGCRSSIPAGEMVMKAKSYMFHIRCFVCSVCWKQLVPGDRFHCENGTLFCDQEKLTGSESSRTRLHSSVQDGSSADQRDQLIER
uniref:Zgc:56628 n=1 Tax=Astyanax mexicanus TaxID=7994 RepID=A0A8B9K9P8_ASTMX